MRRKLAFMGVTAWLIFGVAALASIRGSDSDFAELARVLPALPFAVVAEVVGSQRSSGRLWDSAHGPPFLTLPGILVVYFLPTLIVLAWLLRRRTPAAALVPTDDEG